MSDFFNAALPWIIMGVVVAIATAYMGSKEKNNDKDNKKDE